MSATESLIERNTHLLDWLGDGYTHCQHGTKEWCEAYLHNARDVIVAQDAELEALRSRCERMERALASTEKNSELRLARLIEANNELEAYRARALQQGGKAE